MDIFKMLQVMGPMMGQGGKAGGGGGNPLLGMAGNDPSMLLGPLGKMLLGGKGGGSPLGPVGGPRELPQPIEAIDPGPSTAAGTANAPVPVGGAGGGSPLSNDFGSGPLAQPAAVHLDPGPIKNKVSRGPLGDVGDFIGSDVGKGALFRAGAGLLGGGSLGDAMMMGAGHVDKAKAAEVETARYNRDEGQQDRKLGIDQQGADADALYKGGQLKLGGDRNMIDLATLQETIRKNVAGETLTAAEQQMLNSYRQAKLQVDVDNNIRTTSTSRLNNIDTNSTSEANNIRTTTTAQRGQDIGSADNTLDRAYQYGQDVTTTRRDADGRALEEANVTIPNMHGAVYDPVTKQHYIQDPATGQAIPVTPQRLTTRNALGR